MTFAHIACSAATALALAVATALCWAVPAGAQDTAAAPEATAPDPLQVAFLKDHVVASGPASGGVAFSFPADFYDGRLFLLGESHGVAAPQVLDLELLTHLNARIGLTDYLAEVDPIQAATLNRYLETGDETLLDRVFDHWTASAAQWGNTAFENKIRGIRALNLTLEQQHRVRLLGIDSVQDWPLLASWVNDQGGSLAAEALATAPDRRARASLALAALDGFRGDVAPAGLRGVLVDIARGQGRETVIFNAYARAVRDGTLAERPAYGLWGMFHVMQGGISGGQPFAARVVASDLPTADKVVSLLIYSLDSSALVSYPGVERPTRLRIDTLNIDGPLVNVRGAAALKAASEPGQITLFHAAASGSPFLGGGDFVEILTTLGQSLVPDMPAAPFSAFAQYVGVFHGSDWAPPRE